MLYIILLLVITKCSGRPIFIFLITENWFCIMIKHHGESNFNILLTRNLPVDSGVRQRSHPLTIPLHCFWSKSNNRTCVQFERDVTWFCFYFEFVRSHARCGCCSIVCQRGCGGRGFVRNQMFKVKGGGTVLDLDGQGDGGS